MSKWQDRLKFLAENGDQAADDIMWETREMSDDELARYVAENDERIRQTLGMKYLAEKDADPELNKEYYDLLNKGQHAFQGPGKVDAWGYDKDRSLDEWMDVFGVPAKHIDPDGKRAYSDDERAAFTNPKSPTYFRKLKSPAQMMEIASWQGFDGDADLMADHIQRSADMFQRGLKVEGWSPDNELQLGSWLWSSLKGLGAPRIKEAELEGRDITKQDIIGDMAELGLNFVPGYGIVSKAGKLLVKVPPGLARGGAKAVLTGIEASAVPAGSQLLDMQLYNEGPRSEWDWKRFGAQAGTMGAGMMGAGAAVKQGRRQMMAREGSAQAAYDARQARTFLGSIGEKTDDIIAQRQAALDANAKLAQERKNVLLTGDKDIRTSKPGEPTWEDVAAAEDYRIRTEEAKRLARSNEERQKYNSLAEERKRELESSKNKALDRDNYMLVRERQYFEGKKPGDPDYPLGALPTDENFILIDPEQVPLREGYVRTVDSKGNERIVKQADIDKFGGENIDNIAGLTEEEKKAYMAANENGAKEIVQLPNGKFVYRENIDMNGNYVIGDPNNGGYGVTQLDMGGRPNELKFLYADGSESMAPKGKAAYGGKEADRGYGLGDVKDRNQVVKVAIEDDPYLVKKMEGGGNRIAETGRDATVMAGFNSMYHNDLIPSKYKDVDQARSEAYWNSQLKKLSEFTSSKYDPKDRKRNFEAVMDVMAYGLNNIPDEKFRKNPEIYHAIAKKLGNAGWKHPSEYYGVTMPTNSTSTAESVSSSSGY